MSFRGRRPKLMKERVVSSKFVKKTSSVLKRKRKYENDYPKEKVDVNLKFAEDDDFVDACEETDNGENAPSISKSYREIKLKLMTAWKNVRQQMHATYIEECVPLSFTCSNCRSKEPNICRCLDCNDLVYCRNCIIGKHFDHPLHVPEQWNVSFY